MSKLTEMISNIPDENLRKYLTEFADAFKDELGTTISRMEFQRFERTVEAGFDRVDRAITELAEAQKRTEERLTRLETVVAELAEAQKRTEESVNILARKMDRFDRHMTALGARWGIESEQSFRNGMRDVIEDLGYKVENIEFTDEEGVVFGSKAQIELDIVVRNGKTIAIEIKSSISKGDLGTFRKKVDLYEKIFERKVDELLVISPFIDPRATVLAHKLGIKLATSEDGLNEDFD